MPSTVNSSKYNFTIFFFQPVKITTYNILRLKQDKSVRKVFSYKIIRRKDRVLDPFSVTDTGGNILVYLVKLLVLFNHLGGSFIYLVFKNFLLMHQFAFPDLDIKE